MLDRSIQGRTTLGADRAYDTHDFVWILRALGVTPHIAENDRGQRSAIDGRTTRHLGCRRSQRRRKLVEGVFGWIKMVGAGGKLHCPSRVRNKLWFELTAAYNLTLVANIEAAAAWPNRAATATEVNSAPEDPQFRPTGPTLYPEAAHHQLSSDCRSGLTYGWLSSLLEAARAPMPTLPRLCRDTKSLYSLNADTNGSLPSPSKTCWSN